jgi:hypothetical protein
MLRCVANNYPLNPSGDDAIHVKSFFSELQYILPCEICKYTFKQHLGKHPLDKYLGSKSKIMEWVELMYEETKKVIRDKRIKILDVFEEKEILEPISVTKNVRSKEINYGEPRNPLNSFGKSPKVDEPRNPLNSFGKSPKVDEPKQVNKIHKMDTYDVFGKQVTGRKIEKKVVEKKPIKPPSPQIQISKQITNVPTPIPPKQIQQPMPNIILPIPKPVQKPIPQPIIPKPIQIQQPILPKPIQQPIDMQQIKQMSKSLQKPNPVPIRTPQSTLSPTNYRETKIAPYNAKNISIQYNSIPRTNNISRKELLVTKRCKKCEDK